MVEISPQLRCLFSAAIDASAASEDSAPDRESSADYGTGSEPNGAATATDAGAGEAADSTETYTVSVPKRAIENGQLHPGNTYRVAILDQVDRSGRGAESGGDADADGRASAGSGREGGEGRSAARSSRASDAGRGSRGGDSRSGSSGDATGNGSAGNGSASDGRATGNERPEPPVDEGEVRTVTVEAEGDQGDGIAKVERGYVVIVPGAEPGDRPTVEITTVRQNVAFAELQD